MVLPILIAAAEIASSLITITGAAKDYEKRLRNAEGKKFDARVDQGVTRVKKNIELGRLTSNVKNGPEVIEYVVSVGKDKNVNLDAIDIAAALNSFTKNFGDRSFSKQDVKTLAYTMQAARLTATDAANFVGQLSLALNIKNLTVLNPIIDELIKISEAGGTSIENLGSLAGEIFKGYREAGLNKETSAKEAMIFLQLLQSGTSKSPKEAFALYSKILSAIGDSEKQKAFKDLGVDTHVDDEVRNVVAIFQDLANSTKGNFKALRTVFGPAASRAIKDIIENDPEFEIKRLRKISGKKGGLEASSRQAVVEKTNEIKEAQKRADVDIKSTEFRGKQIRQELRAINERSGPKHNFVLQQADFKKRTQLRKELSLLTKSLNIRKDVNKRLKRETPFLSGQAKQQKFSVISPEIYSNLNPPNYQKPLYEDSGLSYEAKLISTRINDQQTAKILDIVKRIVRNKNTKENPSAPDFLVIPGTGATPPINPPINIDAGLTNLGGY